jgi:UDP-3-O-[3-hydroxymyristoyl] glucosamine N-acyltransferase
MVHLNEIYQILGLKDHQTHDRTNDKTHDRTNDKTHDQITGLNSPSLSNSSEIAVCIESHYLSQIPQTQSKVILTTHSLAPKVELLRSDLHCIVVVDGRAALYELLRFFDRLSDRQHTQRPLSTNIHPTAIISPTAYIHPSAMIGPYCIIEDGCDIAEGCHLQAYVYLSKCVKLKTFVTIYPHAYLGDRTELGHHVIIGPNAIIGMHGFGLDHMGRRLPHLGKTIIDDHAEVSGLSAVDRATLGVTYLGQHTQIDHLVQVGHNVFIEDHVILCAQVGISGGAVLKSGCVLGGQVGVNNRVEIGANAKITAKSGVTKDLKGSETYAGYPAEDNRSYLKRLAQIKRFFSKLAD